MDLGVTDKWGEYYLSEQYQKNVVDKTEAAL